MIKIVKFEYPVDDDAEAKRVYDILVSAVSGKKLSTNAAKAFIPDSSKLELIDCDHDEVNRTGSVIKHKYDIAQRKETIKDSAKVKEVSKL